jgi:hypothetical protein
VLVIGDPNDPAFADPARPDPPTIPGASYLQSYTPRDGDIVHAISQENIGVLVLGRTNP